MSLKSTSSQSGGQPYPGAAPVPFVFDQETNLRHYILSKNGLRKAEPHTVTSIQHCDQSIYNRNNSTSTPDLHILTGSGSADVRRPLSISDHDFNDLCTLWHIPAKLLKKCRSVAGNCIEYCIEERAVDDGDLALPPNATKQSPQKSLSIVFNTMLARGPFFCLLTCDLAGQSNARCIIGCEEDAEMKVVLSDLEDCTHDILSDPAMIIGIVLANVVDQVGWAIGYRRGESLALASRLGIMDPAMRDFLADMGYNGKPDQEYSRLNVDIYNLQYYTNQDYHFSQSNIVLARGLKAIFESYTDEIRSPAVFRSINDVLRRLESHKGTVEFWVRVTQNQSAVLFNLINQRDSRLNYSVARSSRQIAAASKRDSSAMKTISILTLVFLPGTFVSAIFSTTIFDFNGPDVGYGKVGKAWWIYLLCSLLLTLITIGVWAGWMVWRLNKAIEEERREMEQLQNDDYEAQLHYQRAPNGSSRGHRSSNPRSSARSVGSNSRHRAATTSLASSRTDISQEADQADQAGRTSPRRSRINLSELSNPSLDNIQAAAPNRADRHTDLEVQCGWNLSRPASAPSIEQKSVRFPEQVD